MIKKFTQAMMIAIATIVIFLFFIEADDETPLHETSTLIKKAQETRPNIILFLADDLSWFDVGPYDTLAQGAPDIAITPNLDKLAEEGLMFNRSFTATAMCAATRQQLLTGLYPVRSGAYPNHGRVKDGTKSIVHHFQDLGYRVALTGKTHIGPVASFPFEYLSQGNRKTGSLTTFGDKETEAYITRQSEKPFLLIIASHNPHGPWTRGDKSLYPIDKIKVPDFLVDTKETRQLLRDYYAEVSDLDNEVGVVNSMLKKHNLFNDTLFIFTSEHGSSIPFGKWTTYESGLRTAFIMRWPNKIAAGIQKNAMIEYVDIVPTLIEIAGGSVSHVSTNASNENKSANIKFFDSAQFDGKSFKAVINGTTDEHKNYVFGVHTNSNIGFGGIYPIRSVRSENLKLIHNITPNNTVSNFKTKSDIWPINQTEAKVQNKDKYARYVQRPEFELYDMINDPLELNNIYHQSQYSEQINSLKRQLAQWMSQQGDKGLQTEKEACLHQAHPNKTCPDAINTKYFKLGKNG